MTTLSDSVVVARTCSKCGALLMPSRTHLWHFEYDRCQEVKEPIKKLVTWSEAVAKRQEEDARQANAMRVYNEKQERRAHFARLELAWLLLWVAVGFATLTAMVTLW